MGRAKQQPFAVTADPFAAAVGSRRGVSHETSLHRALRRNDLDDIMEELPLLRETDIAVMLQGLRAHATPENFEKLVKVPVLKQCPKSEPWLEFLAGVDSILDETAPAFTDHDAWVQADNWLEDAYHRLPRMRTLAIEYTNKMNDTDRLLSLLSDGGDEPLPDDLYQRVLESFYPGVQGTAAFMSDWTVDRDGRLYRDLRTRLLEGINAEGVMRSLLHVAAGQALKNGGSQLDPEILAALREYKHARARGPVGGSLEVVQRGGEMAVQLREALAAMNADVYQGTQLDAEIRKNNTAKERSYWQLAMSLSENDDLRGSDGGQKLVAALAVSEGRAYKTTFLNSVQSKLGVDKEAIAAARQLEEEASAAMREEIELGEVRLLSPQRRVWDRMYKRQGELFAGLCKNGGYQRFSALQPFVNAPSGDRLAALTDADWDTVWADPRNWSSVGEEIFNRTASAPEATTETAMRLQASLLRRANSAFISE